MRPVERVGPRLLPEGSRPRAAVLLVAVGALVAALGALSFHQGSPSGLDRAVDATVIAAYGNHHAAAAWLAAPGAGVPAAVYTVAIAVGCLVTGRANGALLAVSAVCLSVGVVELVLKPLVGRTYDGFLAFPSGHATAVFALAATVAAVWPPWRVTRAWPAWTATVAAVALACVVASAVIALRWHYFTDTVAGAAVGIGTVTGLTLLLDTPVARSLLTRATERGSPP